MRLQAVGCFMLMAFVIGLGQLFVAPGELRAQSGQNSGVIEEEQDLLFVDEMANWLNREVVTAAKTSQTLAKAPATMVVITEQMIKDRGYHSLEEILHDLPGFDFDKAYGVEYSTIFMRGFRSDNSERFVLIFDGILENDIWKQTNWISRQYPVTNIKQIEVLYGPASALYGTNAFSGIINVITKKGAEIGKHHLTMSTGTWGRKNIEFSVGEDVKDNVSYNLTFKYFHASQLHEWDFMKLDYDENFSESYKAIFDKPYITIDGRLKEVDLDFDSPTDDYSFHGNLAFGNLHFTAWSWYKGEYEGYWYNPYKRSGKYAQWFIKNQGYQAAHDLQVNDKLTTMSSLTYRVHQVLDSYDVSQKFFDKPDLSADSSTVNIQANDVETFLIKLQSPQKGYGEANHYTSRVWDLALEEQVNYTYNDVLKLIGGGRAIYTDTQEDYNSGATLDAMRFAPRHNRNTYEAYGQVILSPTPKMEFTLGSRVGVTRDENGHGYNVAVPRLSAVFEPIADVIFRLQYAEAYNEPDDWHKFSTIPGDRNRPSPDLKPDRLRSIEAGATIKLGTTGLISISGYRNNIEDLITQVYDDSTNTAYHWENLGKATINGYEVSLQASLIKNVSFYGNVAGAFNYDEKDDEIGDIAPIKINAGLLFKRNGLTVYPKVNFVSKKNTINHDQNPNLMPIMQTVDGFAVFGLNVNYDSPLKGLTLHANIDNLADTEYYNPGPRSANGLNYNAKVLQPGFNFLAGVTYHIGGK